MASEPAAESRGGLDDGGGQTSPPPGRRHVLMITGDPIGREMAGPAIRAFELARVVARSHDVCLVSTTRAEEMTAPFPVMAAPSISALRKAERWSDIIVFQGTLLQQHPWLAKTNRILVVDLYDPMHLEILEHTRGHGRAGRRHAVRASTQDVLEQLRRGDFFMCASERQWDFWIGHLAAVGRINPDIEEDDPTFRSLLAVVPFGVPPPATGPDDPAFTAEAPVGVPAGRLVLWGGGLYPWLDPFTVVRAVDAVRRSVPDIRLVFPTGQHPNPTVHLTATAQQTRELSRKLGLLGEHVFLLDRWTPYDERLRLLRAAEVGVSAHLDHIETRYSFRTRLLDYFWAGLPIVTSAGDQLAELVELRQAGFAVEPGDHAAFAEALERLLCDEALSDRYQANSLSLADDLRWTNVATPLVNFCDRPTRARDLVRRTLPLLGARPRTSVGESWFGRSQGLGARLGEHVRAEGPTMVLRRILRRLQRRLSRAI